MAAWFDSFLAGRQLVKPFKHCCPWLSSQVKLCHWCGRLSDGVSLQCIAISKSIIFSQLLSIMSPLRSAGSAWERGGVAFCSAETLVLISVEVTVNLCVANGSIRESFCVINNYWVLAQHEGNAEASKKKGRAGQSIWFYEIFELNNIPLLRFSLPFTWQRHAGHRWNRKLLKSGSRVQSTGKP